jgi:hypothetical protein
MHRRGIHSSPLAGSAENVRQFTKAPNVLRGMGLMHLAKNEKAKKELAEKGMALE